MRLLKPVITMMMTSITIALLTMSASALALEKENYSQARFDELQSQGAVVLVDVYAPWCPTCKLQQRQIQAYGDQNPDKTLHVLKVSFDNDKEAVKKFRAPRQSTLVLYQGNQQLWFSVAETRYDEIAKNLDKAFSN